MTVNVYRSDDAGAPSLSGTVGALITVLDALLINGYNSVSVTSITRSGSVATVTVSGGHGFRTDGSSAQAVISGAVETDYNGTFPITVTNTTVFTYTVPGTPTTPATGTILSKRAGAGFTKEFSGTNKAVYRAASGNQMRLRIDDTNATQARFVGYETMSDVDTGTGPFPTAAQISGGLYCRKSDTASAAVRSWIALSNGVSLFFLPYAASTGLTTPSPGDTSGHFFFGDITTYKSGDAYHTAIFGSISGGSGTGTLTDLSLITSACAGHYLARTHLQTGGAITAGKAVHGNYGTATQMATGLVSSVDPITGGIGLGFVEINETGVTATRGRLPGLWGPLVTNAGAYLDTLSGSGNLSGKTFLLVQSASANTAARVAFEISNTW